MSGIKKVETAASETVNQAPDPVLMQWVCQPAKSRPVVAIAVAVFIVALVVLTYFLTYSPLFAVVAALILWGSLSQFYLQTTFEFTERKVKVKYLVNKIEKEWAQYRSFYVDKNGVLLSPFVRPSRLENFRGLYIRFAGNRDAVAAIVKSKIRVIEDEI
ncbi:MAG: hypothetical protein WBP42_07305 [Candidatus Zixiibacteriota bacterium]